MLFRMCRASV